MKHRFMQGVRKRYAFSKVNFCLAGYLRIKNSASVSLPLGEG